MNKSKFCLEADGGTCALAGEISDKYCATCKDRVPQKTPGAESPQTPIGASREDLSDTCIMYGSDYCMRSNDYAPDAGCVGCGFRMHY